MTEAEQPMKHEDWVKAEVFEFSITDIAGTKYVYALSRPSFDDELGLSQPPTELVGVFGPDRVCCRVWLVQWGVFRRVSGQRDAIEPLLVGRETDDKVLAYMDAPKGPGDIRSWVNMVVAMLGSEGDDS